jgi:GT2 family glycosyltransferase
VVDNGSVEKATFDYYDSISKDPRVTVVSDTAPFNYAAIHNRIVPHTQGDVLAFLNNDIEVESPSWLDTMTAFALQPAIGIVGAKLHFPNNRIQHAGVIVSDGFRLTHYVRGEPRDVPGPRGLIQISREVQAVTGACMVMRRSVFDEVGGFDEAFAVNFNDIDLCLRTTQRGYRIVLAANSELFHVESATRGKEEMSYRKRLEEVELNLFRARWGSRVAVDPHFRRGATGIDIDPALSSFNRAGTPSKPWTRSHWE